MFCITTTDLPIFMQFSAFFYNLARFFYHICLQRSYLCLVSTTVFCTVAASLVSLHHLYTVSYVMVVYSRFVQIVQVWRVSLCSCTGNIGIKIYFAHSRAIFAELDFVCLHSL